MAELNTIITLRQGTTAEWNNSTVVLQQGEMGLEYLVDGSVKIKAGDGEKLWSALPYIGSDIKSTNIFQVELTGDEMDDIAAIEAKVAEENVTKQDGDVAIVKTVIADGKYSYTSYVYEAALDTEDENSSKGWSAMDGNYSASNVFLKKDITIAGNFDKVGNYEKNSKINAGTSLEAMLSSMLSQRLQPSATSPSGSILLTNMNATNGGNVEVEIGTTYSPKYKTSFSAGSFTYGPETGVTPTAASVAFGTSSAKVDGVTADIAVNSLNGATGTLPGYVVPDTTKRYLYLTYGWTASTGEAVDNLGDLATNGTKIDAATGKSATSTHGVTGIRKMFGGSSVDQPTLDSNTIRNLVSNKKSGTGTFEVTIAEGANYAIIAVPAGRTVTKVADANAFGTDIFSEFNDPVTVSIGGADATIDSIGNYAMNYNVYVYAPSASLSANTYTVTVA